MRLSARLYRHGALLFAGGRGLARRRGGGALALVVGRRSGGGGAGLLSFACFLVATGAGVVAMARGQIGFGHGMSGYVAVASCRDLAYG